MSAKPELTKHEARAILADEARAYRCGVRNVSVRCDYDTENGWIVHWSCDVFDPDKGEAVIAEAWFLEIDPQPMITWLCYGQKSTD